jgi:acyl dehydratase
MTTVWDDLKVGAVGPEYIDAPLTLSDFVRYQGASGDMNPIHHDAQFAASAGYPEPFAVGMRQAGVLGCYATRWLGAGNIRRFKVQFREQAWPRDVIVYQGRVVDMRTASGEHLVDVDLKATRQDGGVHLLGWATFVAPFTSSA